MKAFEVVSINIDEVRLMKFSARVAIAAMKEIMEDAYEIAVDTCPLDTGELRDSHEVKFNRKKRELALTCKAPYGVFVHAMPQSWIKGGRRAQWLTLAFDDAIRYSKIKFRSGMEL